MRSSFDRVYRLPIELIHDLQRAWRPSAPTFSSLNASSGLTILHTVQGFSVVPGAYFDARGDRLFVLIGRFRCPSSAILLSIYRISHLRMCNVLQYSTEIKGLCDKSIYHNVHYA